MTFEEFCKMKYYTANSVVIPLIRENRQSYITRDKKHFINPKLKRKNKYDFKKEEKWLKKVYDDVI